MEKEFWKKKKLHEMSQEEWEALCDHCGKCCLKKHNLLGKTVFTNFHCRNLNIATCHCIIYGQRLKNKECIKVSLSMIITQGNLLPDSCTYKLLYQGKDLPEWHPLKSGTYQSIIDSKNSVKSRHPISEDFSSSPKYRK